MININIIKALGLKNLEGINRYLDNQINYLEKSQSRASVFNDDAVFTCNAEILNNIRDLRTKLNQLSKDLTFDELIEFIKKEIK